MQIVVIGGVAAGTRAAARAKRINPEAEIIILERDSDISYSGCGFPYYISDLIKGRGELIVYNPTEFQAAKGVEVRTKQLVKKIVPANKEIQVKDLEEDRTYSLNYDKLLIATGAEPVIPPIPGVELDNIFTLRNVRSAERIKSFIEEKDPQRAVIVGGGHIGMELAENFLALDLQVTVVEMAEQILTTLDPEMAELVSEHLIKKGVEILTDDGVVEFAGSKQVEKVITDSGVELEADFVVLAIGVRPNVELAKKAGIELGQSGAIKVNSKLETSLSNIYAAGDCVESKHLLTDKSVWIPLGSTANKQGRVAGSNLGGKKSEFEGVLGTAIAKVCDLTVASTGLNETMAEKEGFKVVSSTVRVPSKAGYYSGPESIFIKLVINQENEKLLGAQVVGEAGVDKRIDVLATAIYNQMTVKELVKLDLAYAPPYSTPIDGLLTAGIVAGKEFD
ncbi:FAD-dependent oxidoreductase [Fuchsiella alkaliacetigena]|uniref:FAD-dependent oxidoreductase n=1 Tax=Fuchsiella alkaliacetigena TaxID=957042 RepID=UPI00200A0B15|nr:FAD-dependent oxidoreductase [Fuchsiella alkaliacetigena]MCK8823800.1 FAD-dependent oxidoreductase [Fuchsiella alkaliacetigena]